MTRHLSLDHLPAIALPEQPNLSPDGTQIAYVVRTDDSDADRVLRNLWLTPVADGDARQLTYGGGDSAPRWSPDGSQLAFVRSQDGAGQLWRLFAGGGEAEQLTTLPLGAGAPWWSPDGTRIAFSAPVDLDAEPDEDAEDDAARERRSHAPLVADRLDYQADGAGLLGTRRQHVHVLDLDTNTVRQVTEGDWHAGDPAWSPDGTRLAFPAGREVDADLTSRVAAYVVDARDAKARPEMVGLADGVAGPMVWTADGTGLLVVGYPGEPVGHARLLRLAVDSGALDNSVTDLSAALDRNVMPGGLAYPGGLPALIDEGRTVLFCAREGGCTHVYSVGVDGGEPQLVLGGPGRNVSGLSVHGTTAALVLGTPTSFGEVVAVFLDSGIEAVRTSHSESAPLDLLPRVEREFRISDGSVVHGWLVRDPDATSPQPLLLDVHGGPHNAWNGAADPAHLYQQDLASRGWTVLLVNPRGSDGYGEGFYGGVRGGWGSADAKDFLEPLDQLVSEGIADARRLAVTGYSYGGFMTCYLTSRDDRFAAAVAGGLVADLAGETGTADVGNFLGRFELGATPWTEPERYRSMSPITRVDQVRTPTLVLHGAEDRRCSVGQAQQWFAALRQQDVPTRLVLYPGASHLFILDGRPSHRLDYNRRIVDWVEQYAGDADGMHRPRLDAAHWQQRLSALAQRHGIPGAALGILRVGAEDELVEAAYGVLNKDTGVSATTDSLFQIGSITKVWTATVVMQLVDERRLDLDAPVVEVLPELRLTDPDVTKQVTVRHLLTHTSGIDGDDFTDTGRGDDCLEQYVARLDQLAQNHPIGATWSYCNSGFVLLGRVIEKLTGGTWDQAMRERLFSPLGLGHTVTLPEEALLHRAAVGHTAEGTEEPTRAAVSGMPRSIGPAGLVSSTPADVLTFARMHLAGGVGRDGTRVLSEQSTEAMADCHADLPDKHSLGDSWGLGWIRYGWDGHRLVGHDGNTIGQSAFLRLLPEQGVAVTLLTNGGKARDLYEDLYREIFAEVADVAMPLPLAPPPELPRVDVARHVGTYERAGARMEVLDRDGQGVLRVTPTGPLAELLSRTVEDYDLVPVDATGNLFAIRAPGAQTWAPVTFYALSGGERYLHFGARATPKVG